MNLAQILELFGTLLDSGVLIPGLALSFGLFVAYILISAKHYVPLTTKDAEALWKSHKSNKQCKAKNWHEITKDEKLIGYECDCGFRSIQKKPLINLS